MYNSKFKTMKKLFLVLALVAAYGVSMAMSGEEMTSELYDQVTVVADADDKAESPEKEKTAAKEAKSSKADGCATAKADGCATSKAQASTTAKADGCATAKKEGCTSKKTASTEKVAENK